MAVGGGARALDPETCMTLWSMSDIKNCLLRCFCFKRIRCPQKTPKPNTCQLGQGGIDFTKQRKSAMVVTLYFSFLDSTPAWQPVCDQHQLYQTHNLTLCNVHYKVLLQNQSMTEAYNQSVSRVPAERKLDPRGYHGLRLKGKPAIIGQLIRPLLMGRCASGKILGEVTENNFSNYSPTKL